LDLSTFRAIKLGDQMPVYSRAIPAYKQPFSHIVELHNKKSQKRRVIACESSQFADEFTSFINLANQFLTYQTLFTESDSQ
jgi:hypothetical protein